MHPLHAHTSSASYYNLPNTNFTAPSPEHEPFNATRAMKPATTPDQEPLRERPSDTKPQPLNLQLSTDAIDEDRCIFPKQFSMNKDLYFTTNTTGQVLEISNATKQFKSLIKRSLRCDPDRFPLPLESTKPPDPLNPFATIKKNMSLFDSCIRDLVISGSNKELFDLKGIVGVILKRQLSQVKSSIQIPLCYYKIPMIDEMHIGLSQAAKLSSFQMYQEDEWPRVMSIIMDIIHLFGLDYLLEYTEDEFTSAFPKDRYWYIWTDTVISYAIMSLVHFQIFCNPIHESFFYHEALHDGGQNTKCVLDMLNDHYKNHTEMEAIEWTPETATTFRVRRALFRFYKRLPTSFHRWDRVIKRYTFGFSYVNRTDGRSDYRWYKVAYDRHKEEFKEQIEQLEALSDEIDRLIDEGKEETTEYKEKLEQHMNVCREEVDYQTSRDYCFVANVKPKMKKKEVPQLQENDEGKKSRIRKPNGLSRLSRYRKRVLRKKMRIWIKNTKRRARLKRTKIRGKSKRHQRRRKKQKSNKKKRH